VGVYTIMLFANAVCFPSSRVGYMVGNGIAKTTDGGASWIKQSAGPDLAAVCFTDTNRDRRWILQYAPDDRRRGELDGSAGMTNYFLYGVSFTDANTGTAVGSDGTGSCIIRTTDGGATWTNQPSGLPGAPFNSILNAVCFLDANTGIAVGQSSGIGELDIPAGYIISVILRTTNGGSTWAQDPFTSYNELLGVSSSMLIR